VPSATNTTSTNNKKYNKGAREMKTVKKENIREYIGKASTPTEWFTVTQEQIN